ncbi:MAG TPA: hypothetical protein VLH08_22590 [Acidobacteriota bacterium]|nr:hypothetical protein [Acidobacteriota bacterium]
MQENHITGSENSSLSIVYLAAEEGKNTELLLFDERFIAEQSWKRKASEKSKKLIERLRARYDQVTCDLFASDRFVRRLQKLKKITIILNQPIDPALVRNRLKVMLRDRSYHHLRWMLIDALILPFTIVMMPVPGPNLIGYYLLFRVYSHWKAYRSASKTRLDEVDVEVSGKAGEVREALQRSKDIRTALHELRNRFGLRALQEHQFVPQSSTFREAWKNFRKENP